LWSLRSGLSSLLLLRCCDTFALRLLLPRWSQRTFSRRCGGCRTLHSLLLSLFLFYASRITLRLPA